MPPILVNTAESMSRIRVVTIRDDSEHAVKVLQKTGVIHIEESRELRHFDKNAIEQEHRQVNELLTRVSRVLGFLPHQGTINIDESVEVVYTRPFSEISEEVTTLYNKTNRLHERIESVSEEIRLLSDAAKYLKPLSDVSDLRLSDLDYTGRYLFARVYIVPGESSGSIRESLGRYISENIAIDVENETVLHVAGDIRSRERSESVIESAGGRKPYIPDEDSSLKEFLLLNSDRLASLEKERDKLIQELAGETDGDLKRLVLLREALFAENERLSVLEKAGEAKYIALFEGWVPDNALDNAVSGIKEEIEYVFVDTRNPEKEEEPPVQYRNRGAFKPFQIIVNMFATPKYREWDPTPVITYSFAFFFGLMVCDVLYAIGLMLLTRFVLKRFTDDPHSDNFRQFQRLLYTCSGVALIGGLMTGQYFGDIYTLFGISDLALVKGVAEALQDPLSFIIIALVIGFVHVNISHIMAFIKAIKMKDKGNIIGKLGLALLQLGLPGILHSILGADFPGFTPGIYSVLSYFMLAGIIMIFVSSIMVNKGLGVILWLFDITGLLGDVMSYARLAGVGLATFYLAATFNLMAGLFSGMMSGVIGTIIGIILAAFILTLGHTINLVLTAITGFMHSLRLCFVEFLFKFYEGGGTEYSPFKLRKRTSIPLTVKS